MKTFPPSIFNAYNLCKRQAWLMFRQLSADQDSDYLVIGRLIDQTSFNREKKKVYIANIEAMLDVIIKKNGVYYIAEIKKSSRTLESGIFQLKYYLYLLKKKKGVNVHGLIKIPKEKISKEVSLTEEDEKLIEKILEEMNKVLYGKIPPLPKKKLPYCRKCAHYEFCWS